MSRSQLSEDDVFALGIDRAQITQPIAEEYLLRQQMYHARGGSGMLPVDMVIDALRFCGYAPPRLKREAPPTDWRAVSLTTKVIVTDGRRKLLGEYLGLLPGGLLAVRIGGVVNISEYPKSQVSLIEGELPADVLTSVDPVASQSQEPDPIAEADAALDQEAATEPQLEDSQPDRADPEWREQGPATGVQWLLVTAGDPIYVDGRSARFCFEGPGDGELTVFMEGSDEPTTVAESQATLEPPVQTAKRKKAAQAFSDKMKKAVDHVYGENKKAAPKKTAKKTAKK